MTYIYIYMYTYIHIFVNIHTSLAILEDMFGLSHRLWQPPELTEQLQITGRLFIYLYTSYLILDTPDQICAGISSILSFKGKVIYSFFQGISLENKYHEGRQSQIRLMIFLGIEAQSKNHRNLNFSVSARVCFIFSSAGVLETVRMSEPDFMNDAFSCTWPS